MIKGDAAGSLQYRSDGFPKCWKVKYNQKAMMAHRVIYEMYNGAIRDGLVIDHIDGDPSNNRVKNLRAVTKSVNAMNTRLSSKSTTGKIGVTNTTVNGCEYYVATWHTLSGKMANKYFSVKKLGSELALHLASEYRLHMIYLLNINGAQYTPRHGEVVCV